MLTEQERREIIEQAKEELREEMEGNQTQKILKEVRKKYVRNSDGDWGELTEVTGSISTANKIYELIRSASVKLMGVNYMSQIRTKEQKQQLNHIADTLLKTCVELKHIEKM